jgi:hypothetical protein
MADSYVVEPKSMFRSAATATGTMIVDAMQAWRWSSSQTPRWPFEHLILPGRYLVEMDVKQLGQLN